MSKDKSLTLSILLLAVACISGCQGGPSRAQLRQSQLRTFELQQQTQMLAGELGQSQMMYSQLAMERQRLEDELRVANSRLTNLADERSRLHDQYKNLLTNLPAPDSPLNSSLSRMFEDLCRRYPQFEYDPVSGVTRFNDDLLFATGSAEIRPDGLKLLQEFAQIMNRADTSQFEILVVGHTDSVPIVRPSTRALHETNWELSAHRATAVVRQLGKYGLSEPRMGIAGYSQYQPATSNATESDRQGNRRVEIYVLAPKSVIAHQDGKKHH